MTPIVRLQTVVSDTPSPTHGGYAAYVYFKLFVNGVEILNANTRVRWADKDKPREYKERIEYQAAALAAALNVELLT